MIKRRCRIVQMAGLVALTGCFELTAVETTPREPILWVSLRTSPTNQVELALWIDPGTDPLGAAAALVSDSIRVDAVMYGGDEILPTGRRAYLVRDVGAPGMPLEIQVPGTVSTPIVPKLNLTPLGLSAGDSLIVSRGAVAHLEVLGLGDSIPGQTLDWSWVVVVEEQGVLSVSGRALPDGRLSIATSLFPADVVAGVLHVSGRMSAATALGSYEASIVRTFSAVVPFRLAAAP